MFKKIFHPAPKPSESSSSDSGSSELITSASIPSAPERRHFFKNPLLIESPASIANDSFHSIDPFDKEHTIKRSRSFSFKLIPKIENAFRLPRSKSVHFAETEFEVFKDKSNEKETKSFPKTTAPEIEDHSSSSVYTPETSDSVDTSDETIQRVRTSLGDIFEGCNESEEAESSDDTLTTTESEEKQPPCNSSTNEVSDDLYEIYSKLSQLCSLLTNPCLNNQQLQVNIDAAIADVTEAIEFNKKTNLELETRLREVARENENLLETLKLKERIIEKLKTNEDKLQCHIQTLTENAASMQEESTKKFQSEIESLKLELEEQKSESETRMIRKIEETEERYSKENSSSSSCGTDCQSKEQELQRQVLSLKTDHVKLGKELTSRIDELQALNRRMDFDFKRRELETERELKRLGDELKKANEYVKEVEETLLKRDHLIVSVQKQLQTREEELSEKIHKVQELEGEIEELLEESEKNEEVYLEMTSLKAELTEMQQELEELREDNNEILEQEMDSLKSEMDTLQAELQRMKCESGKAEKLQKEKSLLKIDLESTRHQVLELKTQNEKLQDNNHALKKKLLENSEGVPELRTSNQFLVSSMRTLIKSGFETLAPMFYPESTEQFTQVYYEYARVVLFNETHQQLLAFLITFILNAFRDLVHQHAKNEKMLEQEIANRLQYQKEALHTITRIVEKVLGHSTPKSRVHRRKVGFPKRKEN